MSSKTLRVPSAQHLGRNWRDNPKMIARVLVRLFENTPTFNYNAIFSAIEDMLMLGVPYEDVLRGIREKIKREDVRKNFLEILPLVRSHFEGEQPDFVNKVSARRYPLARAENGQLLAIPFTPPMVYGVNGRLVFPWFIFWKNNPLVGEKLQLFTTIVKEILAQDPDLEDAEFQVHDYSAPKSGEARYLSITNAADIPTLSNERRDEMLAQFAEGFFQAQSIIAGRASEKTATENRPESDPNQPDLFT